MKIAFFETSPSDQDYFSQALAEHELFFFAEPLTEKNARQAETYEIISVFISSTINRTVIEHLKSARLIATRSTGFDHIDIALCQERSLVISNVPHYGENTVAEHTFALILALSRNVHKSYARGLKEDFSIDGLIGFDLKDKTLGVIGTGHIGLHVIRIAKGFGMHVIASDVHHDVFLSEILHYKYASLDEVLSQSDIVTIHVPYNEHTHHLINQENIKNIKRGGLLINTARGGIVDNEALIAALDDGTLSGAGLDVLEGEEYIKEENQCLHKNCRPTQARQIEQNRNLLNRDNVVFTPHIGFYSEEALNRILDTTIQNIMQFTLGKVENPVTLP
jgi:D-lactate dehydrogenase